MTPPGGLWILPPHRDSTLTLVAPPGWDVCDLQAALVQRLLAPAALAEAAGRLRSSPRALLDLEAARSVLQRGHPWGAAARLRAQGLALAALTATSPVRLRLDDLELESGSTERVTDLWDLAGRDDLPFHPELLRALAEAAARPAVKVVVDCDQRLPFLFAFLRRWVALPQRPSVSLCGAFAVRHRLALGQAFPQVAVEEAVPDFRLSDAPEQGWRWDGVAAPGAGTWKGYLAPGELETPPPACVGAVVPVAALEPGRFLDLSGGWRPDRLLASGPHRPVSVEWHFGAPGVGLPLAQQTAAALLAPGPWSQVAGLRRFHWAVDREGSDFGGQPVRLLEPAPDRTLARSRTFHCQGQAPEEALLTLVRETLLALQAGPRPPSPGRVAGGLVCAPPPLEALTDALRLAADAAVVDLPVSLDGRAQRTVVATNLRTGALLAVDPRLLPFLAPLTQATPTSQVLAAVPATARERLVAALRDRQILEGVRA